MLEHFQQGPLPAGCCRPQSLWRSFWRHRAPAAVLALLVLGCAPALDWREVRPEGAALTAWLPCKPERRVRDLSLGGPPVKVELLSCTAENTTWGIASAAVEGETATTDALRALRAARLRNLDGRELSSAPLKLAGIAQRPEASRFTVAGRRPDGSAVTEHAAVFAHGGRVFHVAALGGNPSAQALETLFENIQARP